VICTQHTFASATGTVDLNSTTPFVQLAETQFHGNCKSGVNGAGEVVNSVSKSGRRGKGGASDLAHRKKFIISIIFSVARYSRESSSTRFTGSLKPGSRKISLNDASGGRGGHRKGNDKQWKDCDVIEEEGLLEDEDRNRGIPRRCYFLAFVLAFILL
ncbi:hypothetical protein LINPERHAP2_LOCUS796, partial [Linum perenne]